ncbi:MAG TPA: hypothetical protein VLB49_11950 [Gemmatimonadales bacterium]|nr:hypothetical protein [Gemmatimonadales bacterium]
MRAIRWTRIGLGLVALAAGVACGGGDSTGPKAGTATVSLVTPNADDGVVLLTLTGPGLANVQSASSSYKVYWRVVSPSEVRAIVVGNLTSGAVLTASVDDVSKVGQYSGTVVEAASRSDVVRTSTSGYGVTFAAH